MPGFDPTKFEEDISQGHHKHGKMIEILDGLDPSDAKVLESAMRDLSIPANRIAAALQKQGFKTTAVPVQTWRKRNVAS